MWAQIKGFFTLFDHVNSILKAIPYISLFLKYIKTHKLTGYLS